MAGGEAHCIAMFGRFNIVPGDGTRIDSCGTTVKQPKCAAAEDAILTNFTLRPAAE